MKTKIRTVAYVEKRVQRGRNPADSSTRGITPCSLFVHRREEDRKLLENPDHPESNENENDSNQLPTGRSGAGRLFRSLAFQKTVRKRAALIIPMFTAKTVRAEHLGERELADDRDHDDDNVESDRENHSISPFWSR